MVEPGQYTTRTYSIESDWTSASYIYECLALSKGGKIKLNSLKRNSFQGDKNQISLWEKLGVKTFFSKRGMYIEKSDVLLNHLRNDFSNMPDLVQTFATTCCALGITFEFSGVETLKIKETDRIEALITELSKLGYILKYDGTLSWDGSITKTKNDIEIDTYGDHRMAMSFAPFAIANENISIKDIEVVSKSYPDFWNDIENLDLL